MPPGVTPRDARREAFFIDDAKGSALYRTTRRLHRSNSGAGAPEVVTERRGIKIIWPGVVARAITSGTERNSLADNGSFYDLLYPRAPSAIGIIPGKYPCRCRLPRLVIRPRALPHPCSCTSEFSVIVELNRVERTIKTRIARRKGEVVRLTYVNI